jgi:hypothetical protein
VCDLSTQYYSPDATPTSNRVCFNASTPCNPLAESETAPLTATSDRRCTPFTYCSSSPCLNGGSCSETAFGPTCECAQGFLGVFCEVADPCFSSPAPCKNGGACSYDFASQLLYCDCPEGACGDCCAQSTDGTDPFCSSGINFCNAFFQQSSTTSSSNTPVGTIAGAALGGLVGVVLLVLAVMWLLRRKTRSGSNDFDADKLMKVYTVANPSYGHLSPEDAVTPNYLSAVSPTTSGAASGW